MVLLVTGGRSYANRQFVNEVLTKLKPTLVIHGDCPTGLDRLVKEECHKLGIPQDPHPADWTLGLSGGPIRNSEMVALSPDLVVVFPGGKGTKDCKDKAVSAGLRILEYKEEI